MRFPIDALYVNKAGNVVHLESNLKPWRVAAIKPESATVIELPAGTIEQTATQVGDTIEVTVEAK